jgi:hypothetical protein
MMELGPVDRAGVIGGMTMQMTPDGKSYAYSYPQELSELTVGRRIEIERLSRTPAWRLQLTGRPTSEREFHAKLQRPRTVSIHRMLRSEIELGEF